MPQPTFAHPDDAPGACLLFVGRPVADVTAALRKTTSSGWTAWAAAGAWTPDGWDGTAAPEREEEETTVVFLYAIRRAHLATYQEALRGILGERAIMRQNLE